MAALSSFQAFHSFCSLYLGSFYGLSSSRSFLSEAAREYIEYTSSSYSTLFCICLFMRWLWYLTLVHDYTESSAMGELTNAAELWMLVPDIAKYLVCLVLSIHISSSKVEHRNLVTSWKSSIIVKVFNN